ncbi:glycosyltransferase [Candidatus Poribacteria bacterium]|nr:glycosyltransferase [Candidatus Poribacteria bacterium]
MARIVHVYKDFWPPIVGGIERSINWMALATRELYGDEITVLVNSRSRATREREFEGLRVIEVGEWGRAFSAPLSPAFPMWLRRLKADIWHFHIPNPTGDVSYLLARPRGAVVATYHSDIVRQKWAMAAYGPFLDAFLRRCSAIMPTSPHLIESSPVLSRFREKCVPVPLGMPLARFERTAAAGLRAREVKSRFKGFPLVAFVGKLRYYKGLHFLVSAMRALPHVHALIMGEGPEGRKLQTLARELGVADRTHFLGELSDEEVVAHLHAADVFVLPSHLPAEAYGLVQIEAMAAGLPVVSTNLPTGVPYINRDGETGLIVPPGNDEALATAIGELLSGTNRRLAMAEAAYRRAHAEFSDRRMAERLHEVYQCALNPPDRSSGGH